MSKGVKYDNDKPRWGLLPFKEVEQVVDVLTFGSKKYEDDNWKKVENAQERYFDAMLRHITEYRYGEKLDSETGKSHLAHAICCGLFMMWFDNLPKMDVTNGTVFVEGDSGIRFDLKPTDLENYYIDNDKPLVNDSPTKMTPENIMDLLKPLKGNGEGVALQPVSDDSCTTSKIGVGISSLSTEPKAKAKKCCYSNMGNAQIVDPCTPAEILRCLQDVYNANDKTRNVWFNMDSMKTLSGENEYVYYGENCTETFFFELFHNKFMRIYND